MSHLISICTFLQSCPLAGVSQKRPPPHTRTTSPRKRLRPGSHSRRDERRRPDRSRRPNQDKSESEETRRREIHRILALDDHEEQVGGRGTGIGGVLAGKWDWWYWGMLAGRWGWWYWGMFKSSQKCFIAIQEKVYIDQNNKTEAHLGLFVPLI